MLRSHRVLLTPMLAGVLGLSALSAAAEPHRGGDRASEERNVILIVGDGMGYNSVDLASLYEHGTAAYQSQEDNAHLAADGRSEEHTSELQSRGHLVCRLLL